MPHSPNRFSSIIAEEELDVQKNVRSPYIGSIHSNKMSAIGLPDDYASMKDSPFWNHENGDEFQ